MTNNEAISNGQEVYTFGEKQRISNILGNLLNGRGFGPLEARLLQGVNNPESLAQLKQFSDQVLQSYPGTAVKIGDLLELASDFERSGETIFGGNAQRINEDFSGNSDIRNLYLAPMPMDDGQGGVNPLHLQGTGPLEKSLYSYVERARHYMDTHPAEFQSGFKNMVSSFKDKVADLRQNASEFLNTGPLESVKQGAKNLLARFNLPKPSKFIPTNWKKWALTSFAVGTAWTGIGAPGLAMAQQSGADQEFNDRITFVEESRVADSVGQTSISGEVSGKTVTIGLDGEEGFDPQAVNDAITNSLDQQPGFFEQARQSVGEYVGGFVGAAPAYAGEMPVETATPETETATVVAPVDPMPVVEASPAPAEVAYVESEPAAPVLPDPVPVAVVPPTIPAEAEPVAVIPDAVVSPTDQVFDGSEVDSDASLNIPVTGPETSATIVDAPNDLTINVTGDGEGEPMHGEYDETAPTFDGVQLSEDQPSTNFNVSDADPASSDEFTAGESSYGGGATDSEVSLPNAITDFDQNNYDVVEGDNDVNFSEPGSGVILPNNTEISTSDVDEFTAGQGISDQTFNGQVANVDLALDDLDVPNPADPTNIQGDSQAVGGPEAFTGGELPVSPEESQAEFTVTLDTGYQDNYNVQLDSNVPLEPQIAQLIAEGRLPNADLLDITDQGGGQYLIDTGLVEAEVARIQDGETTVADTASLPEVVAGGNNPVSDFINTVDPGDPRSAFYSEIEGAILNGGITTEQQLEAALNRQFNATGEPVSDVYDPALDLINQLNSAEVSSPVASDVPPRLNLNIPIIGTPDLQILAQRSPGGVGLNRYAPAYTSLVGLDLLADQIPEHTVEDPLSNGLQLNVPERIDIQIQEESYVSTSPVALILGGVINFAGGNEENVEVDVQSSTYRDANLRYPDITLGFEPDGIDPNDIQSGRIRIEAERTDDGLGFNFRANSSDLNQAEAALVGDSAGEGVQTLDGDYFVSVEYSGETYRLNIGDEQAAQEFLNTSSSEDVYRLIGEQYNVDIQPESIPEPVQTVYEVPDVDEVGELADLQGIEDALNGQALAPKVMVPSINADGSIQVDENGERVLQEHQDPLAFTLALSQLNQPDSAPVLLAHIRQAVRTPGYVDQLAETDPTLARLVSAYMQGTSVEVLSDIARGEVTNLDVDASIDYVAGVEQQVQELVDDLYELARDTKRPIPNNFSELSLEDQADALLRSFDRKSNVPRDGQNPLGLITGLREIQTSLTAPDPSENFIQLQQDNGTASFSTYSDTGQQYDMYREGLNLGVERSRTQESEYRLLFSPNSTEFNAASELALQDYTNDYYDELVKLGVIPTNTSIQTFLSTDAAGIARDLGLGAVGTGLTPVAGYAAGRTEWSQSGPLTISGPGIDFLREAMDAGISPEELANTVATAGQSEEYQLASGVYRDIFDESTVALLRSEYIERFSSTDEAPGLTTRDALEESLTSVLRQRGVTVGETVNAENNQPIYTVTIPGREPIQMTQQQFARFIDGLEQEVTVGLEAGNQFSVPRRGGGTVEFTTVDSTYVEPVYDYTIIDADNPITIIGAETDNVSTGLNEGLTYLRNIGRHRATPGELSGLTRTAFGPIAREAVIVQNVKVNGQIVQASTPLHEGNTFYSNAEIQSQIQYARENGGLVKVILACGQDGFLYFAEPGEIGYTVASTPPEVVIPGGDVPDREITITDGRYRNVGRFSIALKPSVNPEAPETEQRQTETDPTPPDDNPVVLDNANPSATPPPPPTTIPPANAVTQPGLGVTTPTAPTAPFNPAPGNFAVPPQASVTPPVSVGNPLVSPAPVPSAGPNLGGIPSNNAFTGSPNVATAIGDISAPVVTPPVPTTIVPGTDFSNLTGNLPPLGAGLPTPPSIPTPPTPGSIK
jgi:hypothetical protein